MMTNLWLRLENKTPKEFWFLNYDEGIATLANQAPDGESIRKWNGTLSEFLQQKEINIISESQGKIKFQPLNLK